MIINTSPSSTGGAQRYEHHLHGLTQSQPYLILATTVVTDTATAMTQADLISYLNTNSFTGTNVLLSSGLMHGNSAFAIQTDADGTQLIVRYYNTTTNSWNTTNVIYRLWYDNVTQIS